MIFLLQWSLITWPPAFPVGRPFQGGFSRQCGPHEGVELRMGSRKMVYWVFSQTRKPTTPPGYPGFDCCKAKQRQGSQDRSRKGRGNLRARAKREKVWEAKGAAGAGTLGHSHHRHFSSHHGQNSAELSQVPVWFSQGLWTSRILFNWHVRFCATLRTVAHQAPLSMEFSRQEYRSEWVATTFSRGSSWPKDRTPVSCIAGRFFTHWATRPLFNLCFGVFIC